MRILRRLATKYQKRISGLVLDRIDIHIEVPRVDYEKPSGNRVSESSKSIRAWIQAAHDIQNKRFINGKATNIICNADMRIGGFASFVSCRIKVRA
jgi:magnesium chelatase family protein